MKPFKLSNLWTLIALVLTVFMTSCVSTDNNDDEPDMPVASIMGCWGEEYTSNVEGAGVSTTFFKFDNTTYTKIVEYSDAPKQTTVGKYRRENKTLTLNWENGFTSGNEVVMNIIELTTQRLVLQYSGEYGTKRIVLTKMTETEFNSHKTSPTQTQPQQTE